MLAKTTGETTLSRLKRLVPNLQAGVEMSKHISKTSYHALLTICKQICFKTLHH